MMCEDKPVWVAIDDEISYEVNQYGQLRSWIQQIRENEKIKVIRRDEPLILKLQVHYKTNAVQTNLKDRKHFSVHRGVATAFIPNPNGCEDIDHIDGNRLNNRVRNLRWCNRRQNCQNRKLRSDSTTGFKGVSKRHDKSWGSNWMENGRRKTKWFKTKEEAVEYRQRMVKEHYDTDFYIEDR
jgi:hypothetical protein